MSLFYLVLVWMTGLEPNAKWIDTYTETAQAIADMCQAESDPVKCAALLTSVAWFESTFKPTAVGDRGRAHGLYQSHHIRPGASVEEQTQEALSHIKKSFALCKDLTFYTSGRCGLGVRESEYRMALARRLWK